MESDWSVEAELPYRQLIRELLSCIMWVAVSGICVHTSVWIQLIFCYSFLILWLHDTGVLPANQESQPFVQQQREQQFADLKKGLSTIQRSKATDPPELTLLKLYLLEQGQLPFEDSELVIQCSLHSFYTVFVVWNRGSFVSLDLNLAHSVLQC